MKVVFRVDASTWIGSGHVMRCLVLADALKKIASNVSFACLPQQGDMIAYIKERGFHVIKLTSVLSPITPVDGADYLGWLQRSINLDADDFITKVDSADIVITDHYAIGLEWQKKVKAALICKIIAIDDLVREHCADCIIDQTLGRKAEEYKTKTNILAGTNYALLTSTFSSFRAKAFAKVPPSSTPKILLSMGGVDAPNATLKVLKCLVGKIQGNITVLLSPRAPHYKEVVEWCGGHNEIIHCDFSNNMALLMSEHDIAIGAPGTTSWERACLGLPSIIIPLADNQTTITAQLVKHKAAIAVTLNNIEHDLVKSFETLINDWKTYHQNNLILCDGKGTQRVVLNLQQMILAEPFERYQLTLATSADITLVYKWQCHPNTRQYALTTSAPSWEEHASWMANKLMSLDDFFYVVRCNLSGQAVGVLRLDKQQDSHYLVSIFIAPEHYGKGVAKAALMLADLIHPNVTLHATVLEQNKPSQLLFEKANYQRISQQEFIRHRMK
ncbi:MULTISPECIES: UDP-2,4-diacetamido-2,4,6-trideoxy-beta-L-altropyranose hydrolase [Shewanella]|uniref:UDP-2,4-diacetamido-2,4, 6-trideoxy-beta-L-altropyranose hydrolase n=1 Tax=Shewanella TaxID=22 RepID=UPI0029497798|nr:UDP-2,4-diacetamido-2,4,6-trideoxy-beta-L-altropyranose hydrolase [Shewanella oncorhynchi]WVI94693.1 UDP-2,4-diacetamido-2,4,6-trideoxy-beta-L-altropyranose hydrolase [Shewanella oncorhynchi]GCF91220.1 UDP-2,4-diacetamido-2,4,6-trideoxy-beta-L-altropyranose hydrolase [Shewanella sp. M-Br]